jgi:hypothetical protein
MGVGLISTYFKAFAILFGILFLLQKEKKVNIPNGFFYILLFFIFRFIWSIVNGKYLEDGFLNFFLKSDELSIFFLLIVIYNTTYSSKFIENSILIIKITIVFSAIVSVIQVFDVSFYDASKYFGKWDKVMESTIVLNKYEIRRDSLFGFLGANAIGLSFIPLVSVFLGFQLFFKRKNIQLFVILAGISAILSNTRYIMIGFVIITFQIFIVNKTKLKSIAKYAFFATLSVLIFYQMLQIFGYNIDDWYNSRLFSEGSIEETTRYKAFGNFASFFPNAPILGTGGMTDDILAASHAVNSSHIHVGYLTSLTYYGLIGSYFIFGFWYFLIKNIYKTAKKTNYWGSFFAFFMFLWSFATMSEFSIFYYGLIFAFVFDKYYSDKKHLIRHEMSLSDK